MKHITDMTWKESALIDLTVLRDSVDLALQDKLPMDRATMRHRFNRCIGQVEHIPEAPTALLHDVLQAFEGEEESVQAEHAPLIARLRHAVGGTPVFAPPDQQTGVMRPRGRRRNT